MEQKITLNAFQKLVPEMVSLVQIRYKLLQMISIAGPIGRRILVEKLQLPEREVRNEIAVLNEQHLISVTQKGMVCTEQGYEILEQLNSLIHELSGLSVKEIELAKRLNIEKVIIVPGDVEVDETIKSLLGKEAVSLFSTLAKNDDYIAVTGGSSVAALTNYLSNSKSFKTLHFVAARGSIGDELRLQANTLVSEFANRCDADYRTLFIPDNLSQQAYETMVEEPIVKEVINLYENIDIVIHGIGTAEDMAIRRNSNPEVIQLLKEKHAVGEAFGYYFDAFGQIVYRLNTIGIQQEQVKRCPNVIAIAGGKYKAKAIQAYFKNAAKQTILITDEGAANEILTLFSGVQTLTE